MFETFHVRAMNVAMQAVLPLCVSRRTPSIALHSCDGVVAHGLPRAILRLIVGHRDLTEYQMKILPSFVQTSQSFFRVVWRDKLIL